MNEPIAAPPLPACCIPTPDASLAEILYCRYNATSSTGRQGLAWNGLPCPTWQQLVERANNSDTGAFGVVEKWVGVANAATDAADVLLRAQLAQNQALCRQAVELAERALNELRNVDSTVSDLDGLEAEDLDTDLDTVGDIAFEIGEHSGAAQARLEELQTLLEGGAS